MSLVTGRARSLAAAGWQSWRQISPKSCASDRRTQKSCQRGDNRALWFVSNFQIVVVVVVIIINNDDNI